MPQLPEDPEPFLSNIPELFLLTSLSGTGQSTVQGKSGEKHFRGCYSRGRGFSTSYVIVKKFYIQNLFCTSLCLQHYRDHNSINSRSATDTIFRCLGRAVYFVPNSQVIMPFSLASQTQLSIYLITELLTITWSNFSFELAPVLLGLSSKENDTWSWYGEPIAGLVISLHPVQCFPATRLGPFKFKVSWGECW